MKNALVPSATVVAVAVVLQAGSLAVAPRFVSTPTSTGPDTRIGALYRPGPGLAIRGLASAIRTAQPTPLETEERNSSAPSPASEAPDTDGSPPDRDADSPPVALPGGSPGTNVRALVRVSSQRVAPGDTFRYRYLAKNTGERVFRGNVTVTTHTPAGTFRCSSDLGSACVVPGDYSNGSKSPNETHMNPEAATKTVRIPPGETEVLFVLRLQVSPFASEGMVLRNHAHVRGTAEDEPPITIVAPLVRVS